MLLRSFLFGLTAVAVHGAPAARRARPGRRAAPLTYGVLLGAFGVGAIGGAFVGGRLRELLSSENVVRLAFVGFAVCAGVAVGQPQRPG